jgi:hypothetical protein
MGPQGRALIIAAAFGLTACASPATREGMSLDTPAGKTYPYGVSVRTQGGTDPDPLSGVTVSDEDLKAAIESSIIQSKLFRSVVQGRTGDYELAVSITQLSKPGFGTSFTVDLDAGWALTRVSDKSVVMRKAVKSSHTATMSDAVVGAVRMRLAVEGAVRDNIAQGLKAIADLGSLEAGAGARAQAAQAAAAIPPAGTYPRTLPGEEITAHFARYNSIEARQGKGERFTLLIRPNGTVERTCPTCTRPTGSGAMEVKRGEGLVCFEWVDVNYPLSDCFRLTQTSETTFSMRAIGRDTVIRYSVAP